MLWLFGEGGGRRKWWYSHLSFPFPWFGICLLAFFRGEGGVYGGIAFNFSVYSCVRLRKVRADDLYDMG